MTRPSFLSLLATLLVAAASSNVGAQVNELPPIDQCPGVELGCPCSPSCIEFSASLLFLQPSGGNLEYGTLVSPLPLPTPNWANLAVDPAFSPAFNVGMGYRFPDCGNDVQLTWTHLDTSDNASVVADVNQFVGPPDEIGPDAGAFLIAEASAQFEYDSVNVDIGQRFHSGGPIQVRVFGGLQFARLGEDLTASFRSIDGTIANGYTNRSLFTGVGPRLGMKVQTVGRHVDLLGEIAVAVLVGTLKSRIDFTSLSPELAGLGITPPNTQSLTSPNATFVIPSIDSHLGTGYTADTGYGVFRVEAGYQLAVYVNAIHQYSLSEVVTPPVDQSVGVFLRTQTPLQSNFAVHGPYLTASWLY